MDLEGKSWKEDMESSILNMIYMTVIILFTGPKLSMRLYSHVMVQLGNGQAIIGGGGNGIIQAKIHLLSCMKRYCSITTLNQELSVPRYWFLAIPVPDTILECISQGKKSPPKKMYGSFVIQGLFSPQFFQIASWLLSLGMGTVTTTPITCIATLMEETVVELV